MTKPKHTNWEALIYSGAKQLNQRQLQFAIKSIGMLSKLDAIVTERNV